VEKVKRSMKAVQRTEVPGAMSASRENSTAIKDEHMMPPPSFIPNPSRSQGSHSLVFHTSQNGDFGAMDDLDSGGGGDEPGIIDRNTGDDNTKGGDNSFFSHSRDPLFYPQSSQIVPPPVPLAHERSPQTQRSKTPLFFPLSQLSQQDEQVIRESGLGIEHMNREELEAMLEGDGEEVEFDIPKDMETGPGFSIEGGDGGESLDLFEDEFGPTQDGDKDSRKVSWFWLFLRVLPLCKTDFQAFQPLFED
jgi:cell cycle checkpoint control protein RAD9A